MGIWKCRYGHCNAQAGHALWWLAFFFQVMLQKNGSLIATFQLADTQEIKRWIMTFGPSATVLEPQELAEEICNDLTRMLEMYSTLPA